MVHKIEAPALQAIPGVAHGFFTREGGVSTGIYESLNCGFGSNDDNSNVAENRARITAHFGISPEHLITPYQKHTDVAAIADAPWKPGDAPVADAIVTNTPGLAVGILTADCGPVLFCDPEANVVAAAHAGWRGAKGGILAATVSKMEELGAKRARITAALGPSLSVEAYEVGFEFLEEFMDESEDNKRFFRETPGKRPHFDLGGYIHKKLKELGVNSVDVLQHCTYSGESLFYSYRRSVHKKDSDYGRQMSAIMLTT